MKKFDNLCLLVKSDSNYARMRSFVDEAELPLMPYFGLFLKDIVSVDQLPNMFKETTDELTTTEGEEESKDEEEKEQENGKSSSLVNQNGQEPLRLVNYIKFNKLGEILSKIMEYQNVPYLLEIDEVLSKF